jgi:hypothetical protein
MHLPPNGCVNKLVGLLYIIFLWRVIRGSSKFTCGLVRPNALLYYTRYTLAFGE